MGYYRVRLFLSVSSKSELTILGGKSWPLASSWSFRSISFWPIASKERVENWSKGRWVWNLQHLIVRHPLLTWAIGGFPIHILRQQVFSHTFALTLDSWRLKPKWSFEHYDFKPRRTRRIFNVWKQPSSLASNEKILLLLLLHRYSTSSVYIGVVYTNVSRKNLQGREHLNRLLHTWITIMTPQRKEYRLTMSFFFGFPPHSFNSRPPPFLKQPINTFPSHPILKPLLFIHPPPKSHYSKPTTKPLSVLSPFFHNPQICFFARSILKAKLGYLSMNIIHPRPPSSPNFFQGGEGRLNSILIHDDDNFSGAAIFGDMNQQWER